MSWFKQLFHHGGGSSNSLFASDSNHDEVSKAVFDRRRNNNSGTALDTPPTVEHPPVNEKNEPIAPPIEEKHAPIEDDSKSTTKSNTSATTTASKKVFGSSSKSEEPTRTLISKLQENLFQQIEQNPLLLNLKSAQLYQNADLYSDILQIHFSAQISLSKEVIPKDYVLQYVAQNKAICYHVPSRFFGIQGQLQLSVNSPVEHKEEEEVPTTSETSTMAPTTSTSTVEIVPNEIVKELPKNFTEFDLDIPAMFFAWTTYEPFTDLVGTVFSAANGYDRMDPKYIDQQWKMVNSFHEESKRQSAHLAVFCNENLGLAVFSFRGTESNFDLRFLASTQQWMKNFDISKKEWKVGESTCRVHAGFLEQYDNNRVKVLYQAEIYYKAGYSIIFTGHSQGGGVCTIAALDAVASLELDPQRVYCIPFASPRVGDEDFANLFKSKILPSHTKRWVAYFPKSVLELQIDDIYDMVTQVPSEFFGFRHVTAEPLLLEANSAYSSNPLPIKGVHFECPKYLIKPVAAHCQQVYLDGLLDKFVPERREAAAKAAAQKPANKIKASVEQLKQKFKNEMNLDWTQSSLPHFNDSDVFCFSDDEKDDTVFDESIFEKK